MPIPVEARPPLKVYWQPGCSSCLKTKEFLLANNQDFVSVNGSGGPRRFQRSSRHLDCVLVPIVARGTDWANGAVFRDVARVAGFALWRAGHVGATRDDGATRRHPAGSRCVIQAQIPEEALDKTLPRRPRSYRQLAYHVMNIPDVFLDRVEHDAPYTYQSLAGPIPPALGTREDLIGYGSAVRRRLWSWWERDGVTTDFSGPGKVYYGRCEPARGV